MSPIDRGTKRYHFAGFYIFVDQDASSEKRSASARSIVCTEPPRKLIACAIGVSSQNLPMLPDCFSCGRTRFRWQFYLRQPASYICVDVIEEVLVAQFSSPYIGQLCWTRCSRLLPPHRVGDVLEYYHERRPRIVEMISSGIRTGQEQFG